MSKRGFTLVEIMVATGIAAFVTFVGYFAITTTIQASDAATARVRDTENARLFFTMLKREIATAFPGPGNMIRNHGNATGVYDHNMNPSPLVLIDSSAVPTSSVIQFYSRVDSSSVSQDNVLFVRYYMNRADGTLCRSAIACPPNATPPPDNALPTIATLIATSDSGSALFDGVRSLSITFQKWTTNNKTYQSEALAGTITGSSPTALNCDTLLVTLTFADLVAQKAIVAGGTNALSATSNTSTPSNFDIQTARTFSTVIPIPTTFGP